jgi:hypothetical protein
MASLWVFLREPGVDPTNNRAECSLRFAVMWRKGSSGTNREAGNRWVEWALSLRQTCRQLGQSTFGVLVDAVTSFCQGRQPELAWLYLNARHASPFTLSSRTQETTDAMVKRGAHLLPQARVKTLLNQEWAAVFKQCYPDIEIEQWDEAA